MTKVLATRLARLEKHTRSKRPRPAIVLTIAADEADGNVIGLGAINGPVADRRWGEALPALAQRARTALGAPRVLVARYPAPAPVSAPEAPFPPAVPAFPAPPAFNRAASDWTEWRKSQGLPT